MRVIVTGGAGFIGSHVADALIERGDDVAIVDDLSHGTQTNVNPRARLYRVDIGSAELADVFAKEKPDLVNHHAARTSVSHSVADPVDDARVNILGSLNLLQMCVRFGVRRLIYASSGGALYGTPERLPCDEDHPIRPLSPYGVSKYTVERYIDLYSGSGLDSIILRYANVFGPRQTPFGEAAVVAAFSYRMTHGEPVTIYGNGEQERDFVHVADVVQANLLAMERGTGPYNIGSGESISVNRLFAVMTEVASYHLNALYGPPRLGEVFKIYLNSDRAQKELGWLPQIGLREGLRRTVKSYSAAS